jgi:hypothetical protein
MMKNRGDILKSGKAEIKRARSLTAPNRPLPREAEALSDTQLEQFQVLYEMNPNWCSGSVGRGAGMRMFAPRVQTEHDFVRLRVLLQGQLPKILQLRPTLPMSTWLRFDGDLEKAAAASAQVAAARAKRRRRGKW